MNWKNVLWMIRFVIRKKWIWILSIITVMYCVFIPYQKNLLNFFENPETAEYLFWESVYLFHNVSVLVFMFHIAVQVLNMETFELHLMWKRQICSVLGAAFLLYQIVVLPEYIWYVSIYPYAADKIFLLIFIEIGNLFLFHAISVKSRRMLIGFGVDFLLILLLFGK